MIILPHGISYNNGRTFIMIDKTAIKQTIAEVLELPLELIQDNANPMILCVISEWYGSLKDRSLIFNIDAEKLEKESLKKITHRGKESVIDLSPILKGSSQSMLYSKRGSDGFHEYEILHFLLMVTLDEKYFSEVPAFDMKFAECKTVSDLFKIK